jgi:two-component system, sensor histidine kinase RpfC
MELWDWLRRRFAARPDTEHQQGIVRLVLGVALLLYLCSLPESAQNRGLSIVVLWVFLSIGALLLALSLMSNAVSPARRVIAVVLDHSMVTATGLLSGGVAAGFYPLYIWITLAQGFRYGARYLLLALVIGALGFASLLAFDDWWIGNRAFGIFLLAGYILLSLYVLGLVRQLFVAIERGQAGNDAKRRFISVMSHELRTPLNAIIGMSDVLRETKLDREQQEVLGTLKASSSTMLDLVEEILDFAKIDAGRLSITKAEFDLHALLNSTCKIFQVQTAVKGIELLTVMDPQIGPRWVGDSHHVRQILVNLLGNAVKFTSKGRVTLRVDLVGEGNEENTAILRFTVADTGIGIPKHAIAGIFDSFTQADQSTTRRYGGTGLGTAIVKQLVELMGGHVGVESAEGAGSRFWAEIPFVEAERPAPGSLQGKKILLVGGSEIQVGFFTQALSWWSAQVERAASFSEAMVKMRTALIEGEPYYCHIVIAKGEDQKQFLIDTEGQRECTPTLLAWAGDGVIDNLQAIADGYASVVPVDCEKRALFNAVHRVSVAADDGENVVRLEEYARRIGGGKPVKALVVDDNIVNRQVIGKIIEKSGHEAVAVADGEAALDAMEVTAFDVVVLDRNMPGLGGLETLHAMKVLFPKERIPPTIVLSAEATQQAKEEVLEAGAVAFLAKPVEARKLLDTIYAVMGSRGGMVQARRPAAERARDVLSPSPVVDVQILKTLEELSGCQDFLPKLMKTFFDDSEKLERDIQAGCKRGAIGELRIALHALQGSASSFGASRVMEQCLRASAMADEELLKKGALVYKAINEELSAARRAIRKYVGTRHGKPGLHIVQ